MDYQYVVNREIDSCLSVLNYAIKEDLPKTAKEVARWMASIAFELNRELRDDPKRMSFCAKPYIVHNFQKQTGA